MTCSSVRDPAVRVGRADPLLGIEQGGELVRVVRRRLVDRHSVGEQPDAVPGLDVHPAAGDVRRELLEPVRAGSHAELVDVVRLGLGGRVEQVQDVGPLPAEPRAQCHAVGVAGQHRQDAARGDEVAQRPQRLAGLLQVHQHAVAQHHVERLAAGGGRRSPRRPRRPARSGPARRPARRTAPVERVPHLLVRLCGHHVVAEPGQPDRLGALTGTDVQHPGRGRRKVRAPAAG